MSEQTKSLSKPRKDGFIAKLNRLTRTSLTKDKHPEGMSPDRTIKSDSFFFEKLGEQGLFETTEAAAIAQPFVAGSYLGNCRIAYVSPFSINWRCKILRHFITQI